MGNIIKNYKFQWNWFFDMGMTLIMRDTLHDLRRLNKPDEYIIETLEIIGKTLTGKCISCIINGYSGRLIICPNPQQNYLHLIREIIDGVEKEYLKDILPQAEMIPPWVNRYYLWNEKRYLLQREKIITRFKDVDVKLETLNQKKQLLFVTGDKLVICINNIFQEMGFTTINKQFEGREDIEISHDSFQGVVEIKGLKGYANNNCIRQLLDYHSTLKRSKPDIKGIFIVNHFRLINPVERMEPYTTEAVRLGIDNNFCLMTTYDLFQIYQNFLKGKININKIEELLYKTNGVFTNPF
jgi:hypothetical protein